MSGLTHVRTIVPGDSTAGTRGAYTKLRYGPPEPHIRRLDLAQELRPSSSGRVLVRFAHLTDVHIADVQSPGRFEFMQRLSGTADVFHIVVPAQRPQEALSAHAADSMIRTINALSQGDSDLAPPDFLLCTGDVTDNKQLDELRRFIALMAGTSVSPRSGGAAYEGVQACTWDDPEYWHPDDIPDRFKRDYAFPTYPGLLNDATCSFQAEGARLPWYSLYGNHDALILGTARAGSEYQQIVVGDRKAAGLASDFEPIGSMQRFIEEPEVLLGGPSRIVTSDKTRRSFSRREFLQAHMQTGGSPSGHGFREENLRSGTAYFVEDRFEAVRLIMLDTVNPAGHYQGSIGAEQFRWLEQQLIDVHSRYRDAEGGTVHTGNTDRLVVICSHHGLSSLVNPLTDVPSLDPDEDDLPRVLRPEVETLLHRFPNVILLVNGHTHSHTVRAHPNPDGRCGGFWEVTTGSLLDWPCQARLIEIADAGNSTIIIRNTIVDHEAPPDPSEAHGIARLAALHRELAANDPYAGLAASTFSGQPEDRNVELVLNAPFNLSRP